MKNIKYLVMSTAFLTSLGLGTSGTFAAEQSYQSNAQIEFESTTDLTLPVDPGNPDPGNPVDPIDSTDPIGPNIGTQGPLSIDYASSFQFGKQVITSQDMTYYAETQKFNGNPVEGPNYVQVTDNRGTEAGWTLSVTQDAQFESASQKTLDGAEIELMNANINTVSNSPIPSQVANNVTLTPTVQQPVVEATDGEGAGTYVYRFGTDAVTGAESVALHVPGKTTKYAEQYNTTLTWTLSDTPAN
ncbi:cell surface protein [Bacillus cereus]|nr:cell surface protein [Bacillus cereus]PGU64232.1 cell surface protein [Bacillus cereus]